MSSAIAERQPRIRWGVPKTAAWLCATLAAGPLPACEVQRQARAEGISARQLKRAKRHAGVVSHASRDAEHISRWWWSLPTARTEPDDPPEEP